VDDAQRRKWKPGACHTCACGGIELEDGSLACDPAHPHHIGNQLADELATLALGDEDIDINLARPFESPVMGEEDWIMTIEEGYVQGNIKDALGAQQVHHVLEMMRQSSSAKNMQEWGLRDQVSHPVVKKALINDTVTSRRFRLKLWTNSLPTYGNLHKRMSFQSATHLVYGSHINGGCCPLCGCQCEETMRHVLMECPKHKHIRDKLMRDVHQCWSSENKLQTW